jgi:hypothetical protein
MTRILTRLALAATCCYTFMLTGCPVSSKFPLGPKGAEPVNQELIGTWNQGDKELEAQKIKISNGKDANTYKVEVLEKGDAFMADATQFNGWLTNINKMQFLVLQEAPDGNATETYFVYHIQQKNGKVITNDISLKVNGTDAITSIDAYREEVTASMKDKEFLSGEITWSK